ncbi:MAG: hypothetical protein JF616_04110 [Fibrobacteres bacterium]|jgi:hypothetical protein|nr:hypothetical protein [Fibrobacterota bacterium]
MSARFKTVLIGSLLGAFILLGCDSSTDSGTSNAVAGTWKGKAPDSTMILVFTADTAFAGTLPLSYGTYTLAGKYKLTGNTISLKYASSLLSSPGISPEGVPPPTPDSVTGTLSGNKLTIPIPYDQNNGSVILSKQ